MPVLHGDVLSWLPEDDEGTLAQAQRAASLPFVSKPLALMPDAHVGMGATIGSVIATDGAIVPAAVGVDIGCGMAAARTNLSASDLPDSLGPLHSAIRHAVPAGVPAGVRRRGARRVGSHSDPAKSDALDRLMRPGSAPDLALEQSVRVAKQFGTLGSGNHFVEVCLDEHDRVWVVLHSGSRGIGNQLARHHISIAKGALSDYLGDVPDPDLAHFVEDTPTFDAYVHAMLWAQDYALANRREMLKAVLATLAHVLGRAVPVDQEVNCHHNYCEREHHRGRDLWITRKGAIRARTGDLGIIPGSMGTSSYIVRGKGNAESLNSASHGAGRRMSRTKARKAFDVDDLRETMGDRTWNDRQAESLLDEHPQAYKDIEEVMAAQADLVDVVHRLRQILNYKGT